MKSPTTRLLCCVAIAAGCEGCGESPLADAGQDAPDAVTSSEDAAEYVSDAFRIPARTIFLNPDPPVCPDRGQGPVWRLPDSGASEGAVLWTVSLNEERFRDWRSRSYGDGWGWIRMGPSISGDGVATWFSHDPEHDRTWGLGVGVDARFANSGQFANEFFPRIWLPRLDALLVAHGAFARAMYAPRGPFYAAESEVPVSVDAGIGERFWPDGPYVYGGRNGDMPAWSPVTGDILTFGTSPLEGYRGVGAACSEGTRWFTQLPVYEGLSTAFVRPDGDAIVASQGECWVLAGETGEVLRSVQYVDEAGIPGRPAAYHPGCGVLLEFVPTRSWRWLNDDTMELGPLLEFPEELGTRSIHAWAGTPDCGVAVFGGIATVTLSRLSASGDVRWSSVLRAEGSFGTNVGPPISLADGGMLAVTTPPGWVRYDEEGTEVSRVLLDQTVVGVDAINQPALAPDGTLYFMTVSTFDEYRFVAAMSRAAPGPFLWRSSGYNWARTNSVLPE